MVRVSLVAAQTSSACHAERFSWWWTPWLLSYVALAGACAVALQQQQRVLDQWCAERPEDGLTVQRCSNSDLQLPERVSTVA
ncbi:hypothetical protein COCOBI_13-3600 [Coccomyxa sp. Obi]|nr:hypothetical protein COCOBI_13-3600 [Coccomyxa sp. Obi]